MVLSTGKTVYQFIRLSYTNGPKGGAKLSRFTMARNETVFEISQKTWNRNRDRSRTFCCERKSRTSSNILFLFKDIDTQKECD